jgi:class 3 adenylate cyclase
MISQPVRCGRDRSAGAVQGERCHLTLLFCDISGSTQAAEGLDAEEWAGIMNGRSRA